LFAAEVEQSLLALDAGLPVLLEKPVSPDLASCRRLYDRWRSGGNLLLGYTYRWWEPVRRVKQLIDAGAIGAPRHAGARRRSAAGRESFHRSDAVVFRPAGTIVCAG
jgi:predicted dehydrogenase